MRQSGGNEKKLTGNELSLVQLLACLSGYLRGRGSKELEGVMRSVPRGWTRYRQAMGQIGRLLDDVYDVMPLNQLRQTENVLRNGEITIKLRRAGAYDDDMTVLAVPAVCELINTAMWAECAICLKDRAGVKQCALRKALEEIIPPDRWETTSCSYRDMAIQAEKPGKYV
ncbi:MAG: hypothetical protein IKK34_14065 [Clostridia bacterium]|nr:hypothetical protein [Clostridia bacterium]